MVKPSKLFWYSVFLFFSTMWLMTIVTGVDVFQLQELIGAPKISQELYTFFMLIGTSLVTVVRAFDLLS